VIEGDLTRLRPIQAADLPEMRAWFDDPAVMRHWGTRQPVVRDDAFEADLRDRFARFDRDGYFAVVPKVAPAGTSIVPDVPIGRIEWEGLDPRARSAEVMILIGNPVYWGGGYGTDAMVSLLRYLFWNRNLHRVSLSVLAWNARAIRSYEKAGFVREGVLRADIFDGGRYHDQVLMAILRPDFEARWGSPPD
jgi:RimJ/RimL family protein N-acetyltransferase